MRYSSKKGWLSCFGENSLFILSAVSCAITYLVQQRGEAVRTLQTGSDSRPYFKRNFFLRCIYWQDVLAKEPRDLLSLSCRRTANLGGRLVGLGSHLHNISGSVPCEE